MKIHIAILGIVLAIIAFATGTGKAKVVVNLGKGIADIEFDEKNISEKEIKERINGLGYKA